MSQRVEFRVRWKREGRQRSYRIYQSWDSAYRKAQGVLALEAVKEHTTFDGMPDLEERPVIEQRPVGNWDDGSEVQDPSDYLKRDMCALYPIEPGCCYGDLEGVRMILVRFLAVLAVGVGLILLAPYLVHVAWQLGR